MDILPKWNLIATIITVIAIICQRFYFLNMSLQTKYIIILAKQGAAAPFDVS